MTEREKWEAGLWYDANYTPELCAEREKAEELYTEFNQTRPSEKAKRAELLRQLLPHMEEHVVILPHLYVDYGYHCFIGAGTYINHGGHQYWQRKGCLAQTHICMNLLAYLSGLFCIYQTFPKLLLFIRATKIRIIILIM